MKYTITHITTYTGTEAVSVGFNEARLQPRECPLQACHQHRLEIAPEPSYQTTGKDYFGNPFASFSFGQGYEQLRVTSRNEVHLESPPERPSAGAAWNDVAEQLRSDRSDATLSAYEFAFASPKAKGHAALTEYTRKSFPAGRPILEALTELTARIHKDFAYDPRATTVTTPVADVFEIKRGVCQDFAHLQIAGLRSIGLAARYVSGYLRTYPPPGKTRLVGADASHAWLSVYCGPEIGWLDVDPTNNRFTSTDHVTVAWGRDYGDVPPLKGVFIGGGQHTLKVSVDVCPTSD